MYRILHEGHLLGYAEKPIYIKNKNGIWIDCDKTEAEGIAYDSTPYIGAVAAEVDDYKVLHDVNASLEQVITDIEISQIEDEQMLTDHDIAILELQNKEA